MARSPDNPSFRNQRIDNVLLPYTVRVTWLLVGAGGAIGSMARYGLNLLIVSRAGTSFPTGIFLINVLGSALIGVVVGLSMNPRPPMSDEIRTFLAVGVLGGFTTFSSFSLDTLLLLRSGRVTEAVINAAGQVLVSLVAVWIGFRLGTGN